jgi:hypothetical protein
VLNAMLGTFHPVLRVLSAKDGVNREGHFGFFLMNTISPAPWSVIRFNTTQTPSN